MYRNDKMSRALTKIFAIFWKDTLIEVRTKEIIISVLVFALLVIVIFTYYISVAKVLSFRKRFLEMAGLSLTIAAINFCIGWVIRSVFGVDL